MFWTIVAAILLAPIIGMIAILVLVLGFLVLIGIIKIIVAVFNDAAEEVENETDFFEQLKKDNEDSFKLTK